MANLLTLRVGFPPGSGLQMKVMKFKLESTIKQIIDEIVSTNELKEPEQYVLLLPATSAELNSVWLDENKPLSFYSIQNKETIELRKKFQVLRIVFRRVPQRFLVNINEPLNKILPFITKKFQLDNIKEFSLLLRKTELDLKKSVRELAISTDATFTLKSENEDIIDEDEHPEEKKEEKKEEKSEEKPEEPKPINLQAPAKAHKHPIKAGFLQFALGKDRSIHKRKFEKKWVVLRDKYMFQYKSQSDNKPLAVTQVETYKVKLFSPQDEKDKKSKDFQYTFELFNDTDLIFIKCDHNNHLKSWMSAFQRAIDGGTGSELKKQPSVVFGAPLSIVCKDRDIPELVEQCVKWIDETSLDTVGIFRLSGSAIRIEKYKKDMDSGKPLDFSSETDPHCVCGLLKLYFRDLPEPICTHELYEQFIAAQTAPDQQLRIRYLRTLVRSLPKINRNLLTYLIAFLGRVEQHSNNNKMYIHNLATVFGPNLLGAADRNMFTMVQDTPYINGIVNTLIKEYATIFSDKDIPDRIAIALYDYEATDESEIGFKQGDTFKIILQGQENDWWQGEIDGKIGRFPGSYVKLQVKSKKQQFKEEMKNIKQMLEEEKKSTQTLKDSKATIEKEIAAIKSEKEKWDKEVKNLKTFMKKIFDEEKLDFTSTVSKYHPKLESYQKARLKYEESRKGFEKDLEDLRSFLKKPEAKKNFKGKLIEKLESQINMLSMKLGGDLTRRYVAGEKFESLLQDVSALQLLLKD